MKPLCSKSCTLGLALHFLAGIHVAVAEEAQDIPAHLHQLRPDAKLKDLGITESYDEAIELEKEIAQLYREVRATKLSQIQRQSLKQSLRQTLLPISERPQPNKEVLDSDIRDGERLTTYQDELQKLMQENDAIVANAEELLQSLLPEVTEEIDEEQEEALEEALQEMAEEAPEEGSEPLQSSEEVREKIAELEETANKKAEEAKASLDEALAEMKKAEALVEEKLKEADDAANELPKEALTDAKEKVAKAIESLSEAKEDMGEKVAQARQAMEQITAAIAATNAVDSDLQAKKASEPQQHTEKAIEAMESAQEDMQAAAQATAMAAKLSEVMSQHGSSPQKQIAQQQALQTLARAESGSFLDLTRQMKGQDLDVAPAAVREDQKPPPIHGNFNGIAGRKFVSEGGRGAGWFHVNQWYILGPYDNRGRMNIQRVYPPESSIDLDAHYIGRKESRLSWAYDSFAEEMVNPSTGWGEYTIYYGFTELYFEEASDLWIAVGSDDRSDLWINDMPVWHSSNQLKNWSINEGFRKVHFKKGRNKVVFRLENGWQLLGFSLLVNTGSKK